MTIADQPPAHDMREADTILQPCPFCGAPGYAMLAAYGFKIKCTNTDCTVETPIKTHRHQVDSLWNRRADAQKAPQPPPPPTDERSAFDRWFYASKYAQVATPTTGDAQRAWDAWIARADLARKRSQP
jgi:hypothetical protein